MPRRLSALRSDFVCRRDSFHNAQILIGIHGAAINPADFIDDIQVEIVLNAAQHAPVQQIGQLLGDFPDWPVFCFKKTHPGIHQPADKGIPILFRFGQLCPALRAPADVSSAEYAQHLLAEHDALTAVIIECHCTGYQGRPQCLDVIVLPCPIEDTANEQRRLCHGCGHAEGRIHGYSDQLALLLDTQSIDVVRAHDYSVLGGNVVFDEMLERPANLRAGILTIDAARYQRIMRTRFRRLVDSIAWYRITLRR